MSLKSISNLTQSQRDRLAFIELRARFVGEVGRQDLVNRFGTQAAAATRDIATYKELAPGNLDYDSKNKIYICAAWFRPIFDFSIERVLTWLGHGYGDGEPLRYKSLIASESIAQTSKFKLDILSVITRAIHRRAVVGISYGSPSAGLSTREIVPFAIADNGNSWQLRAYDRRSQAFCDFTLARITGAGLTQDAVRDEEMPSQDIQWNRIVDLELVPHPANVQHPDVVESEYVMTNGVLRTQVRAALVGSLLRHWGVDCSADHNLKSAEYQLWLRNPQALYGITNLTFAPGYKPQDIT
jgi:WYL domain